MFSRRKELPFWARLKGWLWPSMGWRRLGVYLLMRLTRLTGTAHSIALGFACGSAVSFTPFVGFHIVLSMLVAYVVRGHVIASAVGTVVGNPWTFPFIWLATYKTGQVMLGNAEAAASPAVTMFKNVIIDFCDLLWPALTGAISWQALKLVLLDLSALVWPMLIGSLPLALLAGVVTYFPLVRAIRAFQDARQRRLERRARERAKGGAIPPNARSESCLS